MDPGTMDDPDTVLVYDRTVSLWLPFDREDFEPRVFRRLRQAARSTVQTSAEDEAADDLLALTTVQNAPNVPAGSEEDRQVQALETSAEDEAADDVLALTTGQNAPNVPAGSEEDRQVQAQALETSAEDGMNMHQQGGSMQTAAGKPVGQGLHLDSGADGHATVIGDRCSHCQIYSIMEFANLARCSGCLLQL